MKENLTSPSASLWMAVLFALLSAKALADSPLPTPIAAADPPAAQDQAVKRAESLNALAPFDLERKPDYLIPIADILAFELLLNRFDYYVIDRATFGVTASSIRHNLQTKWVIDNDPFSTNQFEHPYQGATLFGFARSAGIDYWRSMGYSLGGSALWEIAGETTPPSVNDLVSTGIGGTFLGEPMFRMASLLLEKGDNIPPFWRELGAAAISPSLGFNRLVFGDRFRAIFASHDPAYFMRVGVGTSYNHLAAARDEAGEEPKEFNADFQMAYGLPGKSGYTYTRPFDYFDFQFTATNRNFFENILSRGMLVGKDFRSGARTHGIWGLYGSYDYFSPRTFRVSNTAFSLGTTREDWPTSTIALQSTALAGVGYGSASTIHGTGERNYHYGVTPHALLTTRAIFGDRVNLDLAASAYYVSKVGSSEYRGSDTIFRGEASVTVRLFGRHALMARYVATHRDARYTDLDPQHQTIGTVSLFYTYLNDMHLGAVGWRDQ